MKVGGGGQQQQTKTDPWDGLKPYLIGLDGRTGIMPEAERLYKEASPQYFQGNTYAGLNDKQQGAMSSLSDYYKSPESMAGANAAKSLAGDTLSSNSMTFTPSSIAWWQDNQYMKPVESSSLGSAPAVEKVGVGSSGVDWKTAMGDVLKGEPNNPYLSQIAGNIGRQASDNYLRNLAPQIRSGAQVAGQYGGSRQGVIEANALRDLNQGVSDSVSNLYGNAYNQAQQAKSAGALALSNQESGERTANAQIAANQSLAQAQLAQQRDLANAQMQMEAARLNNQTGLSLSDMMLRSQIAAGDLGLRSGALNLQANDQNFNQKLTGVGLLNQASQQPITNMQGLLGIGNLQQQDAQNQINADLQRWNYNQTAPWQNLENYMGLVTGAGGRYGEGMGSSRGFNWGLDFTDVAKQGAKAMGGG